MAEKPYCDGDGGRGRERVENAIPAKVIMAFEVSGGLEISIKRIIFEDSLIRVTQQRYPSYQQFKYDIKCLIRLDETLKVL